MHGQPHRRPALSLLGRSFLAGTVAGATELLLLGQGGFDLALGVTLEHLIWVAAVGTGVGLLAVVRTSETISARFWLIVPSLLVLYPFLAGRLGLGALVMLAFGVLLCVVPKAPWRESVLAGAVCGTLVATQLALFVVRDYDGRDTDLGPIFRVAATAIAALVVYVGVPRAAPRPLVSSAGRGVVLGALCLGAVLVLGFGGPPELVPAASIQSDRPGPPIILVVLDTVRADHLELYGYHRDTMPELTQFARSEAVVAQRAITNAPDSLSAHASLFTGLYPSNHGAHRPVLTDPAPPRFGYPLRPDVPTVAEILRDVGYVTVGVSANAGPISSEMGFGIDRGFDVYRSVPNGNCNFTRRSPWSRLPQFPVMGSVPSWLPPCEVRYRRAEVITDEAIRYVDAAQDSSFFLFVNYMEAHLPYSPPPEFRRSFLPADADDSTVIIPSMSTQTELSDSTRVRLNALYDAELRYLDRELGRLLDHLRRHPEWEDVLVIITSDHGEALGEHGLLTHTSSVYDVMIRVPLILKPGREEPIRGVPPPGSTWDRPMQLVDLMPIVLKHAGVAAPATDGRLPSQPVGPLRAWSFPSQAQIRGDARFRREFRSIELDGWKLIEDDSGSVELYDTAHDPDEHDDVADTHPAKVEELRALMGPRTAYRMEVGGASEPELSKEVIDRLRSLGYVR